MKISYILQTELLRIVRSISIVFSIEQRRSVGEGGACAAERQGWLAGWLARWLLNSQVCRQQGSQQDSKGQQGSRAAGQQDNASRQFGQPSHPAGIILATKPR